MSPSKWVKRLSSIFALSAAEVSPGWCLTAASNRIEDQNQFMPKSIGHADRPILCSEGIARWKEKVKQRNESYEGIDDVRKYGV